jgi:hypothetical protein
MALREKVIAAILCALLIGVALGQGREGIPASLEAALYVDVAGDTMTGPLELPDGTVSLPALAFSDGTNWDTGLYAVSAKGSTILYFTANGVEQFNLDNGGATVTGDEFIVDGDTTLGDAVGDQLTFRGGTVTFQNDTTWAIDGDLEADATGKTVAAKGTWDFSAATLTVPTYAVHHHVIVAALSKGKGANPPTAQLIGPWFAYDYDPTTDDELFATWELPEDYSDGTDITITFRWAPSDAKAGTVTWGVEHEFRRPENAEVLGAGSTTQIATDDAQEETNRFQENASITMSGTGVVSSDVLAMRIFRDADASEVGADDDYPSDASLIELHLIYTADTL